MKTIWKFPIAISGGQEIMMPKGALILSVDYQLGQGSTVQMWALVDPGSPLEKRLFTVIGTGHSIPEDISNKLSYIDTFQLADGRFIGHVFEIIS